MANFRKNTRYTNGLTTKNRSGQNFLILRSKLDLPDSDGDTYVTITQDILNRPDLISYKAYNTPDLWWAIYEYNNIRDPLFDMKIGHVLKIPQLNRVLKAIQQIGKS